MIERICARDFSQLRQLDLQFNLGLTVITGASGAGTDYQIQLKLHEGMGVDSAPDYYLNGHTYDYPTDIWFVGSDGTTLLNYIADPTDDPTDGDMRFWIEIAESLESAGEIYIYYGLEDAITASNLLTVLTNR